MNHTHTPHTTHPLPFGWVLQTCICGCRRRSYAGPIAGIKDGGWHEMTPSEPSTSDAYRYLQSEGYEDGPEPHDAYDYELAD